MYSSRALCVPLSVVLVPQEDRRPVLRLPVGHAADYGSVRCASIPGAMAHEGPVVQTDA